MDPRHTREWHAANWRRKAAKYEQEAEVYSGMHERRMMSGFSAELYRSKAKAAIAEAEKLERPVIA